MIRRRRTTIVQRRPIFLGCEGESEQAYGQVLNDLLREAKQPFHLDGFAQDRPPTSQSAKAALRAAWPDYRKPMTKVELMRRIALDAVQRAPGVEPSLSAFLHDIRLLPR
jgi:hypothetical protein